MKQPAKTIFQEDGHNAMLKSNKKQHFIQITFIQSRAIRIDTCIYDGQVIPTVYRVWILFVY